MSSPDNTGQKQVDTQFKPGQTGNPSGRPRGARNRVTLAVESLLDGQAEQLTQTAIDKALAGDSTAMKICMDRIAPLRKGRPAPLDFPEIRTLAALQMPVLLSAMPWLLVSCRLMKRQAS